MSSIQWELNKDDLRNIVERLEVQNDDSIIQEHGGIEELARLLHTNINTGIGAEEKRNDFSDRKEQYIDPAPIKSRKSFFHFFTKSFTLETILQLIFNSLLILFKILKLGFSHLSFLEDFIILVLSLRSTIFKGLESWVNYKQIIDLETLNLQDEKIPVLVLRGGKAEHVFSDDVFPGDIIELNAGDQIPADGILLSGTDFQADESVITGETDTVLKDVGNPLLYGGSCVANGNGRMMVIAIGRYSTLGVTMNFHIPSGEPEEELFESEDSEEEDTPFQRHVSRKLERWNIFLIVLSALVVVILLIGLFIEKIVSESWVPGIDDCIQILKYLVLSLTLISSFLVTERSTVSVVLANCIKNMLRDALLIRKLGVCEILGSVDVICTGKTGTLTRNEFRVSESFMTTEKSLDLVREGISINTSANLIREESNVKVQGNRMEGALLFHCNEELGSDYEQIRRDSEDKIVKNYFFQSMWKRMSSVIKIREGLNRLHCKGASEIVLGICDRILNEDGSIIMMSEEQRNEIRQKIREFGENGMRTLLLAYKEFKDEEIMSWEREDVEKDLIFLMLVGIKDELKKSVIQTVQECKDAGIQIIVVSGDNVKDTKVCARDSGIFKDDDISLSGYDFNDLSRQEFIPMIPRLKVVGRIRPRDKARLVEYLIFSRKTVAVTGDGTNCAPALHQAHVGFSMGLSGTDVAKAASDIVVLDDDFSSIGKSIFWGRTMFKNVRNMLKYQIVAIVVSLGILLATSITRLMPLLDYQGKMVPNSVPLTSLQLIFISLIVLTLSSPRILSNRCDRSLLKKDSSVFDIRLYISIISQSLFQLVVLLWIHYFGFGYQFFQDSRDGGLNTVSKRWLVKNTIVFNTLVLFQVFSMNGYRVSKKFIGFQTLIILIQIFVVQAGSWDLVRGIFSTIDLNYYQWLFCFGVSLVGLIFQVFVVELILVRIGERVWGIGDQDVMVDEELEEEEEEEEEELMEIGEEEVDSEEEEEDGVRVRVVGELELDTEVI